MVAFGFSYQHCRADSQIVKDVKKVKKQHMKTKDSKREYNSSLEDKKDYVCQPRRRATFVDQLMSVRSLLTRYCEHTIVHKKHAILRSNSALLPKLYQLLSCVFKRNYAS